MTEQLFVGTRKGLFVLQRRNDTWNVESASFLGAQVPVLTSDPREKLVLAALKHEHFGAKMQRSEDNGQTWQEVATPAYPPKPGATVSESAACEV